MELSVRYPSFTPRRQLCWDEPLCWPQVANIDGKPTIIGLESYPVVTLAMGQGMAVEHVRAASQGNSR